MFVRTCVCVCVKLWVAGFKTRPRPQIATLARRGSSKSLVGRLSATCVSLESFPTTLAAACAPYALSALLLWKKGSLSAPSAHLVVFHLPVETFVRRVAPERTYNATPSLFGGYGHGYGYGNGPGHACVYGCAWPCLCARAMQHPLSCSVHSRSHMHGWWCSWLCMYRFQLREKCSPCPDFTFSRSGATKCIQCPTTNAVECVGGQLEVLPGFWWEDEITTRIDGRRLAIVNEVSPADQQRDMILAGITADTVFHKCPSETACIIGPNQRSQCANGTTGYVRPPLCVSCWLCDRCLLLLPHRADVPLATCLDKPNHVLGFCAVPCAPCVTSVGR